MYIIVHGILKRILYPTKSKKFSRGKKFTKAVTLSPLSLTKKKKKKMVTIRRIQINIQVGPMRDEVEHRCVFFVIRFALSRGVESN